MFDRTYKSPTLVHVGVLMANYFCCQSRGEVHRALSLLAEACQLTYFLRMHEDLPDEQNVIERELRRRIFWHVYAVDITEACAGNMIHLNEFEGLPSLPLVVDDELITPRGAFAQAGSVSYMAGFNGCVQLFPLLAEVVVRSKRLARRREPLSAGEVERELAWEADLRATLDGMVAALPPQLRAGWVDGDVEADVESSRDAIVGMQRANIFVTESSLRICLLDYISEIVPSEEVAEARSSLARRAYDALSSFPLDHLAANGESIRGKIFRIVMALLKTPDMDADWVDMVHNWWGLFSRVNFVQLGPPSIALDSESD
ncbi:hypothetical protein CspeluHIS016_0406900 [Cutaneotrichosporon spelunceum]|uniref:Xylanolytic transcriptional activator regulatory domain-containing protein n=1 Tax=Cutaneotrichosporon spelunceum TaxID=1672016 RepID=A0AAD3TWG5_9TREE|nr:hypothetical protein CspeluHIS016_0406900 [Cutaneotrichosporon spelunceum]